MLRKFNIYYALCLLIAAQFCIADELDDIDYELEFSSYQKSTFENFPFQEIGQEEMSDTAIEGALQVQTSISTPKDKNGKPIYQKQKEDDQKKQTESVIADTKENIEKTSDLLKFSQVLPLQPQIQPIYQQPTGRTYTDHQTTTLSRP